MVKVITTATISRYKFKCWNFGFLGVMVMVVSALIMTMTNSLWIVLPLVIIGWGLCGWLIEKEVNNWLNKEAFLNITNTTIKYKKLKRKNG